MIVRLVRQTRGFRRVIVPLVCMGVPFMRKGVQHGDPDREQIREQGEGHADDASGSAWFADSHDGL